MARKADVLSPEFQDYLSGLEQQNNLPAGTLTKISFIETNLGQNRGKSSAGAQGLFQFMPATAKRFGVDVHDDYSSAQGAAKYLGWLNKRYDGDITKAAAAYNYGEGNVDKKYDSGRLPFETRNYISMFRDGKDLTGNRQKGLTNLLTTINNGTMIAGMQQTNNQQNSMPKFDTSAFSLDDLEEPVQNNNQQSADVSAAQNNQSNIQNSVQQPQNNTFDTSAFSLDDLEEPVQNNNPQPNAEQSASTPVKTVNGVTIDSKDEQILNALSSHQDLGGYLADLKQSNPAAYDNTLSILGKYHTAFPEIAEQPWYMRAAQGVGLGVNNFTNGVKQIYARATGNKDLYDRATRDQRVQNATEDAVSALQGGGGVRMAGQIVGESLPTALLPAARVVQGATKGARVLNAAAQGALGSVMTGSEADYDNYLEDRAKQATIGAVAAPAVGAAVNAVARPIAKTIAGRTPQAARDLQQEAAREGITLLNSDLPGVSERAQAIAGGALKNNNAVKAQTALNNQSAERAIQSVSADASNFDNVNYLRNNPAINQQLGGSGKYSNEATNLDNYIASIDTSDPSQVLKAAAMTKKLANQIEASNLYDKAFSQIPNASFKASQTKSYLDGIKNLADNSTDAAQKRELMSVYDRFNSVNDFDNFSANKVEDLRQTLNNAINDYSANPIQNKSANTQIINSLNKVKNGLDNDVDNFANSIGDRQFLDDYKAARKYYADNVAPLNSGINKKLFDINYLDDPKMLNTLFNNKNSAKTVMNSLDDAGKQAVQSAALNNLINAASKTESGFNAASFNNAYKNYKNKSTNVNALDTIFGDGKSISTRVNSLGKIMENMTKTVGADPKNGYAVYNFFAQHAPKFAAALGAAAGTGSGVLPMMLLGAGTYAGAKAIKSAYAKVLTDPKYSKFLFEFAQTNPNSDKFLKRADKFISILSANGLNEIEEDM